MWVKTQAPALSVLCSAVVVAASATPIPPTAQLTPSRSAEYRYTLAAAAVAGAGIDGTFNPISYLSNIAGAAQAVTSDVIYWQTPDFPLLVLSAQIDPNTGQYAAVQKVSSTAADLQNLVTAVTAIPGASSSSELRQLVNGIGLAGATAAGATQTVTATLAPYLAPLTPVIYVVTVLRAAVGVYYAVATLATTGLGTVFAGQNPLTAVANVVSSVQELAHAVANAPHPTSSGSTGSSVEATTAASQAVGKTTGAAVTHAVTGVTSSTSTPQRAVAGQPDQTPSRSGADTSATPTPKTAGSSPSASPITSDVKSAGTQAESPVLPHESTTKQTSSSADTIDAGRIQRPTDPAATTKSITAPTSSKAPTPEKPTVAADPHAAPSAATATQPAGRHSAPTTAAKQGNSSTPPAQHSGLTAGTTASAAKSGDHQTHENAAGHAESAPKTKADH
ncbi:MAG: hypothetical protein P4L86_11615 [Mycobacterium sp.]|nr:hypothetical protein [Mycobacterium sp.]